MSRPLATVLVLLAGALLALPGARPKLRLGLEGARPQRLPFAWLAMVAAFFAGLILGALPILAGVIGFWAVGKAVAIQRTGLCRRRAEHALAEIVELAASDMRAGAIPAHALIAAAAEVQSPVSRELKLAARRLQLGQTTAAFDFAGGDKNVDLSRFRHLWLVSQAHGLPLGLLFQQLSADLSARHQHRERLMASLAGPRTTMWILAGLPVLGIGMGQLIGTNTVHFLLFDGMGAAVLVVGVALMSAGLLWSVHLTETAGELG